jgi:hypothetical protein
MKGEPTDLNNALPISNLADDEISTAAKKVIGILSPSAAAIKLVLAANATFIPPPKSNAIRKVIVVEGVHYEQRLNCCHKVACHSCFVSDRWIPSHGPYWYMCLPLGRKWIRVYLGKHLDTSRFRGPDGKIDYSIALPRSRRSPDPTTKSADAPGQLTLDGADGPIEGIGP